MMMMFLNIIIITFFLVAGCRNVSCRKNRTCVLDKYERALCIKCNYPCGSYHGGEVCGADNITYQSNCHLKQKTCEKGTTIGVAYKGRCHGKEQPSICSLFSFNVNFSFECQILPCDCIGYWRSLVVLFHCFSFYPTRADGLRCSLAISETSPCVCFHTHLVYFWCSG